MKKIFQKQIQIKTFNNEKGAKKVKNDRCDLQVKKCICPMHLESIEHIHEIGRKMKLKFCMNLSFC